MFGHPNGADDRPHPLLCDQGLRGAGPIGKSDSLPQGEPWPPSINEFMPLMGFRQTGPVVPVSFFGRRPARCEALIIFHFGDISLPLPNLV
jgi:hypothetical protein